MHYCGKGDWLAGGAPTSEGSTSHIKEVVASISGLEFPAPVLSDRFKQVKKLVAEQLPPSRLEDLIAVAKYLGTRLPLFPNLDVFKYQKSSIRLHGVLREMMNNARECGGQESVHYTTVSVVSCIVQNNLESEETFGMVRELAEIWLKYFLFPFRLREEMTYYVSDFGRWEEPRAQIERRERFECAITGADSTGAFKIFWPSIVSDDFGYPNSTIQLFDILKPYASLRETLDDFARLVNSPANGFAVMYSPVRLLEQHALTLKETTVPNIYTLQLSNIVECDAIDIDTSRLVKFNAENGNFAPPDPRLIRIHAVMGEMLYLSQVDVFVSEVVDRLPCHRRKHPIRCWDSLDRVKTMSYILDGFWQVK